LIAGIQTESAAQQQEEWRSAMERSRRVLSSQEKAMEEYLRRQRKEAERHIRNSPLPGRKHVPPAGLFSMPATPTGSRRSTGGAGDLFDAGETFHMRLSRGGSLERQSPGRFVLQGGLLFNLQQKIHIHVVQFLLLKFTNWCKYLYYTL
jgi:hypothetical protein